MANLQLTNIEEKKEIDFTAESLFQEKIGELIKLTQNLNVPRSSYYANSLKKIQTEVVCAVKNQMLDFVNNSDNIIALIKR